MNIKFLLTVAAIGVALAAPAQSATSPCKRTANSMHRACGFDIWDDYQVGGANCRNINDKAERRACWKALGPAVREERDFCDEQLEARLDACGTLNEFRYDPDPLTQHNFIEPDLVPSVYPVSPWVSIAAGHTYVLRAGEEGQETVVVHVTDDEREILGVNCRVVIDVVIETSMEEGTVEYTPVEVTDDWFAQDETGDVYYCGEVARNFEDGVLRDLDGSFEAGLEQAKSGLLIAAFPTPGVVHRQEFALGEAEDIVEYVDLAASPSVAEGGENSGFPCGGGCLKTFDFAPLDPEATEFKYYLPGTGFVLAVGMEDGELTGEREELLCIGDSLDLLSEPACEIADPALLRDVLCELSPAQLCAAD